MGPRSTAGLTAGILAAALLTASCAADPNPNSVPRVCGPDPTPQPAEIGDSQSIARWITNDSGTEDPFNLYIDVANLQNVATDLHVEVDGQTVLAIRVPGRAEDCPVTPVYRYGLAVPAGDASVVTTADSGHHDDMTVEVADSPTWIVVQLQPDFALELEQIDHAPGWD